MEILTTRVTGEITLRGKVLPIGGLKEKLLAAHRVGIMEVIMPNDNEKDLPDSPENLRNAMKLHFVDTMDDVLRIALEKPLPAVSTEAAEADAASLLTPQTSSGDQPAAHQ